MEDNSIPEYVEPHTQELRRSSRIPKIPDRYVVHIDVRDEDSVTIMNGDPLNYKEAIQGPEAGKWREAMDSEIQSMCTNQVWNLVDLPEGRVPLECKWIFKKKIGVIETDETCKARLVAKGYRQRQGVDYDETFSPVAMIKSIRILLAIATHYDYVV